MAPGDQNTVVFGRADIWKTSSIKTASTSSGWTQIASTSVVQGNVSAIGISKSNTDKIYIGTSNGRIHVTTNNGTDWTSQLGFPYVSDLWVDIIMMISVMQHSAEHLPTDMFIKLPTAASTGFQSPLICLISE